MAMIFAPAIFLILLDVMASAQVPSQPDDCSWMGMRKCYSELGLNNIIGKNMGRGLQIDEKVFSEICKNMILPSPCYGRLSACPADVKANLSSFEEGYRQLRDIHCDENAYKDSLKVLSCMDPLLLAACTKKYIIQRSEPPKFDECSTVKTLLKCTEEIFPKSCPADHKSATASFKRAMTAALLMDGCETSSQAGLVPMNFTIALVVSIILLRLKAT
ncbi:uncharacterized protein LOC144105673 [Amblyomma americanum]